MRLKAHTLSEFQESCLVDRTNMPLHGQCLSRPTLRYSTEVLTNQHNWLQFLQYLIEAYCCSLSQVSFKIISLIIYTRVFKETESNFLFAVVHWNKLTNKQEKPHVNWKNKLTMHIKWNNIMIQLILFQLLIIRLFGHNTRCLNQTQTEHNPPPVPCSLTIIYARKSVK